MRILYGVCGVGYGHATRTKAIAEYLQKKGHQIKIITHGQAYELLKNNFPILHINGIYSIFNENRIKKTRTVACNLRDMPENIKSIKKIRALIKEFNPQICITDMEPTVTLISKIYRIPLISIDNEHSITHLRQKIKQNHKKDYFIASNIVRTFASGAKHFIILTFTKAKPSKRNVFIAPPIIREEVKKLLPHCNKKILVYLSRGNQKTIELLKEIPEQFIIYGFNTNKKENNLTFKTKETFLKDLQDCEAIIATAGFSLLSEAVFLKKPYFALPLKGHYEQIANALFLKQAGFGEYSENLKKEEIISFLGNLEQYRKKLKEYNPDYDYLFKILEKLITQKKQGKIAALLSRIHKVLYRQ